VLPHVPFTPPQVEKGSGENSEAEAKPAEAAGSVKPGVANPGGGAADEASRDDLLKLVAQLRADKAKAEEAVTPQPSSPLHLCPPAHVYACPQAQEKLSKADRRLAKWEYRDDVGPLTEEEEKDLMDEVRPVLRSHNCIQLCTIVYNCVLIIYF
jgi:hypothetical protein